MHAVPQANSSQCDGNDQGKSQSWELEKPALLDKHLSKTGITGIETVENIHFIPKLLSCIQFPYPTLLNSSTLPIVTVCHQIILI